MPRKIPSPFTAASKATGTNCVSKDQSRKTPAASESLVEQGLFDWSEWAEQLGVEIKAAQRAGDPDLGDTYYQHWLCALEKLVSSKGLVHVNELLDRKVAWAEAAAATPHGEPIELQKRITEARQ